MINVLQWQKGLRRERLANFVGSMTYGINILIYKTEGEPVFYNLLPKTYDDYRQKYVKLFNRKLP